MKNPNIIAIAILVLGIVVSTVMYRGSQTSQKPNDFLAYCDPNKPCLGEIEKKLVETQDALSKWMLGIAYTTLGGMLVLRVRNWRNVQITSALPMTAVALLLLSLFGAFLFQVGLIFTLSKGPLYHLSTGVVWVPLLTQFWPLVAALALLGVWLYGPRRAIKLMMLAGLLCTMSIRARAADIRQCANAWQRSRGFEQSQRLADIDTSLIAIVLKRAGRDSLPSCGLADSILDQVRYGASIVKQSEKREPLIEYTTSVLDDLRQDPLSLPEVVSVLVSGARLWDAPSGLLTLDATTTHQVVVDTTTCLTPCTVRLGPGSHHVEATSGGMVVYSCSLVLKNDDVLKIKVDHDKCR